MNKADVLVAMASWEERFLLGFRTDLEGAQPGQAIVFFLDGYADWTRRNREAARKQCALQGIRIIEEELVLASPAENWDKVGRKLPEHVRSGGNVLVDITTMRREQIWTVLWFLEYLGCDTRFVYHSPGSYNKEWLSRDPLRPRLIYKMSGIAKLGSRTCLIVLPGYDVDRAQQLISFFEPAVTFVGLQRNGSDEANDEKMTENKARLERETGIEFFDVNAYGPSQGQAEIQKLVELNLGKYNIIMSSLGPKPSAVGLYRIQRDHPETGLAYAPSRQFNRDYSTGIGRVCEGAV